MADEYQTFSTESDTLPGISTDARATLLGGYSISPLGHIQISDYRGTEKHYALYLLLFGEVAEP